MQCEHLERDLKPLMRVDDFMHLHYFSFTVNIRAHLGDQTSTLRHEKWRCHVQFNDGSLIHACIMHGLVNAKYPELTVASPIADRTLQSPFEDDQPSANNVIPPKNPMPAMRTRTYESTYIRVVIKHFCIKP